MDISALLPDSSALRLEGLSIGTREARLVVSSSRPCGICPGCGRAGSRVHSHYERKLQDLPWHGTSVVICWRSRKFFCDTPGCPQQIFTERLPVVADAYGRRTTRAREILECLGISVGGEAGSRLAERLGMAVSGDSLLRIVHRATFPSIDPPRVIGVDDWALRRGHRYGSIIVDLERHRPIALLPDRKWETFRDWLREHPGVDVISRDRADCYARGASSGAPDAIQVVDRFHLLQNLREALQRATGGFLEEVRQAATEAAMAKPTTAAPPGTSPPEALPLAPPEESAHIRDNPSRSRRLERYRRIRELHDAGVSQREIARVMGLNRKTVRRMLRAASFPERAARVSHRDTDSFLDHLKNRWGEGCHNARTLHAELVRLGYRGSYHSVRRTVTAWRGQTEGLEAVATTTNLAPIPGSTNSSRPSVQRVSWLLFLRSEDLDEEERSLVESIRRHCPPLATAMDLTQEFRELVKNRQSEKLADWITRASDESIVADVRRFALGLAAERSLIEMSIATPWSNGQVEGQVNRLKLLKRETYGRAKLDLLETRFLHALL